MKKRFVADLKVGNRVQSFFVAKHKQLEYFRDKSKGRFLTVVLADRTGQILARAWDDAANLAELFEEEDVVAVRGRVDEYMGRPQIIVDRLRVARPEEKDTLFSEDDFVPQTEKDVDALWAAVSEAAQGIGQPHLRALVESIFSDEAFAAGLRAAPASKAMHHSYRGGLLEHIQEMLTLGRCLGDLYPLLDQDLLTAGILLHDLGSVEAARYERQIDYSDAGRLLGHVVLGDRLVSQAIAAISDFPPELALRLSHLILSHHGQYERGAVREPQTLEAVALYHLNALSAGLHHVRQVMDAQWDADRPWTEFDRLTGRSFFRGGQPPAAELPDSPQEAPVTGYANDETDSDGDVVLRDRGVAPRPEWSAN